MPESRFKCKLLRTKELIFEPILLSGINERMFSKKRKNCAGSIHIVRLIVIS